MYIEDLETPALVLDLDKLERNLERCARICKEAGVDLRPHIKTHKIPAIAHKQIKSGAVGITVAKLGEAEVMAAAGIDDIFIAYNIVGEKKVERLLNLARSCRIITLTDDVEVALPISEAAKRAGLKIEMRVEVDAGIRRTGVEPGEDVVRLARQVSELPAIEFVGIMTHEGHVHECRGFEAIAEVSRKSGEMMVEMVKLLRDAGIDVRDVSVGSTPSLPTIAKVKGITEVRPGGYVFNDRSLVHIGAVSEDDCAVTILATVVSRPAKDRAVIDTGSKALTADLLGMEGYGIVKGWDNVAIVRLNEEHGMMKLSNDAQDRLKIGERLEIIPNHVCLAMNLYDSIAVTRGGYVEAVWPVAARGKVQ